MMHQKLRFDEEKTQNIDGISTNIDGICTNIDGISTNIDDILSFPRTSEEFSAHFGRVSSGLSARKVCTQAVFVLL